MDGNQIGTHEKWQVLLPESIHESGPSSISDIAEMESLEKYKNDRERLKAEIGKYDAVILRGLEMSSDLIECAVNLKIISKHGSGLNNVDIETATDQSIVVCNTPGANARSVAEMAITHLLALRRNIVIADEVVRDDKWEQRSDWSKFCNHDIQDQTLGLYGCGYVARITSELACGLGMNCVAYDPYLDDDEFPSTVTQVKKKKTLFEKGDVVSIHTPLTTDTEESVGYSELSQVDHIINTARGGIIDTDGLKKALNEGKLAGAGLDTLRNEPPNKNCDLLTYDTVIFSPHIGGQSIESTQKMSQRSADNIRRAYLGKIPETAVNSSQNNALQVD